MAVLSCIALQVYGQGILAPSGGNQNVSRSNPTYFGKPNTSGVAQAITGGVNPYAWGPISVRPGLGFRYIYGDGLLGQSGEQQDSSLQEISPNFDFEIGERFTANYSPTWRIYADEAFKDVVDHSAGFTGEGQLGTWTFGFDQDYGFRTQSLIEAGRQAEEESWSTSLNAFHPFTNSVYYNSSLIQDVRDVEDFTDSTQWAFTNRLHYAPSPHIDYAVSGTYGYTDIDPGLNMEFQQYTASIGFNPSEKTQIELEAGVDVREFDFSGAEEFSNPIFNATMSYSPRETTTLSASAERSYESSLFEDTVVEREGFRLNFRQRLLDKFDIDLGYNNTTSVFADELGSSVGARDDENESYDARLSAMVLYKIRMSAFYRHIRNVSNIDGFEFDSDQVGVEARYQY